jgi:hypothetical protein
LFLLSSFAYVTFTVCANDICQLTLATKLAFVFLYKNKGTRLALRDSSAAESKSNPIDINNLIKNIVLSLHMQSLLWLQKNFNLNIFLIILTLKNKQIKTIVNFLKKKAFFYNLIFVFI